MKFSSYTTSCEDESLKPWLLENGRLLFLVLGESLPQVKELGTGPVTKHMQTSVWTLPLAPCPVMWMEMEKLLEIE